MNSQSTVFIVQVSMKTAVLGLQFHWSIILGVLGSLTTSTSFTYQIFTDLLTTLPIY